MTITSKCNILLPMVALSLLMACSRVMAQQPVDLINPDSARIKEILVAAAPKTLWDTPLLPAFHMVVNFETFDAQSKPDGTGTMDILWDGKDRSKRTTTYRGVTQVSIRNHGMYVLPETVPSFYIERRLLNTFNAPIPSESGLADLNVSLDHPTLSGVAMECISSTPMVTNGGRETMTSAEREPTIHCFSPGGSLLRLAKTPVNLTYTYNNFEPFSGKLRAREIVLTQGETIRARLHVLSMVPLNATDSLFEVPVGATPRSRTITLSSGLASLNILAKSEPIYPRSASSRKISGTVLLIAIISKAGEVNNLEVLSSPDPGLSNSAYEAVKLWRYKPYLLNGLPVEVETFIAVNFKLTSNIMNPLPPLNKSLPGQR